MTHGGTRSNAGRKPGVPNALSAAAKDVIAQAAADLGGGDRLVAWVKEDAANEKVFWSSIYPKLIPVAIAGHDHGAFSLLVDYVQTNQS